MLRVAVRALTDPAVYPLPHHLPSRRQCPLGRSISDTGISAHVPPIGVCRGNLAAPKVSGQLP